jgi:hypothetical protein
MVPPRFRSSGYGRGIAHLRAALDPLRCSHHYVHSGPGSHLVLHHGAVQSDFPTSNDPAGRNAGVARVETEIGLRSVRSRKETPDLSFFQGWNSSSRRCIRARLPRTQAFWRRCCGSEIPDRALLAIASFIIRLLGRKPPSGFRAACPKSRLSMSRSPVSRFCSLLLLLFLTLLLSTVFLLALLGSCLDADTVPVGVREESRCCHLSVGLEGRSRLAVIGTRCFRNG